MLNFSCNTVQQDYLVTIVSLALSGFRSLVRDELDKHFEYPVVESIEQINTYFRDRLHELLESR